MSAPETTSSSATPAPRPGRWVPWFIVAAGAAAIFFELGRADIAIIYEGQRSVPGIEMLQTGDFVVPRINGEVYIVKPPLLYWTLAGLYSATGVINEFIARLPNALSGVLLIVAVYLYARRALGERAAVWCAIVMAATPIAIHRSRVSDLDMPLAFTTALSILWMWTALEVETRRTLRTILAGLAFGAAILLKGPVAALFVIPAWAAHALVHGPRAAQAIRTGLIATLVFFIGDWLLNLVHALVPQEAPELLHRVMTPPYGLIATAALWLWFAWRHGPADRLRRLGVLGIVMTIGVFIAAPWFLLAVRALGWDYWKSMLHDQAVDRTYVASEINSGSHFFYLIGFFTNIAPWSFLTPLFFSRRVREAATSPGWTVSGLTAIVTMAIFSLIAGKEADYVLSAYPLMAIAFGGLMSALIAGVPGWPDRVFQWWGAIFLPLLAVGSVGVAIYATVTESSKTVLIVEEWVFAAIALVAAWTLRHPARRPIAIAAVALIAVTQGLVMQSHYYNDRQSPQALALTLRALQDRGERVEASLVRAPVMFYVRQPVTVEPDFSHVAEALAGPAPYYYFCRERQLDEVRAGIQPDGIYLLGGPYARERYVLIGNAPLPEELQARLEVGPIKED